MKTEDRTPPRITAAQCRAARALLGWSREALAKASNVSNRTLASLELGDAVARSKTNARITAALLAAGVELMAESEGGVGVRWVNRQERADGSP